MSRTGAEVARLMLGVLAACLLWATPARADDSSAEELPSVTVEQADTSQRLFYTGNCTRTPPTAESCGAVAAILPPFIEVEAGSATLRFSQPALDVKARTDTGTPLTVSPQADPTAFTVDGLPGAYAKELVVTGTFARSAGGTVSYEYNARTGQQLALTFIEYSGNPCTDPTARAVYRVTSQQTSLPIGDARVVDQTSGADGLVRVAAYSTVQATRRGDLPSGTIATPALPCPYTGPVPQRTAVAPLPALPTTPQAAPSPGAAGRAVRLTLEPAGKLRLGRVRFTATSTVAGTFRVIARIGQMTVERSVTFRSPGTVTFSLRPTAKQAAALRRQLGRRSARLSVRLRGQGKSATTVGRLRR